MNDACDVTKYNKMQKILWHDQKWYGLSTYDEILYRLMYDTT